jgi:hypothetical protein
MHPSYSLAALSEWCHGARDESRGAATPGSLDPTQLTARPAAADHKAVERRPLRRETLRGAYLLVAQKLCAERAPKFGESRVE